MMGEAWVAQIIPLMRPEDSGQLGCGFLRCELRLHECVVDFLWGAVSES